MTTKVSSTLLANTAVAAGNYGGTTQIPVVRFDDQGRATYAANVAVSAISIANTQVTGTFPSSSITGTFPSSSITGTFASGSITGLAASATTDTTSATNITSGTLPSARLSGSYTGITGLGTITAGSIATTYITGLAASATTDTTNAGNISSGLLNFNRLPASGVSPGSYGSPTQYPVLTVDATGRITGVTNQTVTTSTNQTTFGVYTTHQTLSGTGSQTSFTLNQAITGSNTIDVFIGSAWQLPGSANSWTASGNSLTFNNAPPLGTNNIAVRYTNQPGAVGLIDSVSDTSNASAGRAATPLAVKTAYDKAVSVGIPTGAIQMWSTATAPTGFLLCNGAAVSRTTYSDLYGIIGNTFGAGNGSTTFNLPNYTNRTPYGTTVGATGGSADAVVVSHTHTATVTDPGHNHTANVNANQNVALGGSSTTKDGGTTGTSVTGITVINSTTGVSGTNANLPPYLGINFIIKT
jgi:microcystin-dependent protein